MKFLMGLICGLIVAIAVPVAMGLSGAAPRDELRSKKSTALEANETD